MQPPITIASGVTTSPFLVSPDGWVIIEAGNTSVTVQYTTGTTVDIANGTATYTTVGIFTGFTAIRADEELAEVYVKLTTSGGSATYHVEGQLSRDDRMTLRGYKRMSMNGLNPTYSLDSNGNVQGLVGPDGRKININSNLNHSLTISGSYTGNGTTQSISCGFKPDFVVIKGDTTADAIFKSNADWYERSDGFNNINSTGGAITFTENGFSVATAAEANTNAITYYYFAYKDNGSGSMLATNWQGNATTGRVINSFKGLNPRATIVKRDAAQKSVWSLLGLGSWDMDGNSNSSCIINADGTLTLDNSNLTNQWATNLGEGTVGLGFVGNDVYVGVYTGNATARNIPIPWQADFIMVQPLAVVGQNCHIWFSSLAANTCFSVAPAGALTGRITATDTGSFSISSGTQLNTNAAQYMVIAFRRNRQNFTVNGVRQPIITKTVQLRSGGYVDCGTSDTLKFNGAHTIEWFGAIYPPKTTPATGGAGADTEANVQNPMISRSNGADAVDGNMSFCLAATAPRPEGTGQRGGDWSGAAVTWATYATWQLPQTGAPVLDLHPAYSGQVLQSGQTYHLMLTHDGAGGWVLYVNGLPVKERQRDLMSAISKPNIQGGTGHRTVLGARQTTAISFAYGQQLKLARIYNRTLTAAEVLQNFNAIYDSSYSKVSTGLIEEWNAQNASGSLIPASINSANNGTIVNGSVEGF